MDCKIDKLVAREVIDLKGNPTVEVDVLLRDGTIGRAAAPAGTSRGAKEAVDIRDGDVERFDGLGVQKAVEIVASIIGPKLKGVSVVAQKAIDALLIEIDGTDRKSNIGGNTCIAISLACAKAAALSQGIELHEVVGKGHEHPLLSFYVMFSGPCFGRSGCCDFQDFSIIPLFTDDYLEAYLAVRKVYRKLCDVISRHTSNVKFSDTAGAPIASFHKNKIALDVLHHAIVDSGFTPRRDFGVYIDIAANQLYYDGKYRLIADELTLTSSEMVSWIEDLCRDYPIIIGIEDPFHEEDWQAWAKLTGSLGNSIQIAGDDLFCSNVKLLNRGVEMNAANAIIIKPNQVGTLTETIATIELAQRKGYVPIISDRSGEIFDVYLPHICVGLNIGQAKLIGAYHGGQYHLNELMRIQQISKDSSLFGVKHSIMRKFNFGVTLRIIWLSSLLVVPTLTVFLN